ncbi:uncharacterized protein LDX57_004087 [Aspergillus melleus]|uniref:uncharacterized protein n=1 Tax=Aspergillus melleus TaxID=138277 RepID=UPI001E8D4BFE|nr:uncharacterized protein LDX57_004087 [Aspergillus melleus]KAH8426344.1 hypothetical protein LDX57_004087 [Aspergillus melleus]
MTTRTRDFRHDDYTVAWACALPLEMAAAAAMLDERHSDLPIPRHDHNTYILGSVGVHNVVIACLPLGMYGTTSAATVASQMRGTFPSMRFGLMVGIGGGAPSQAVDIRLGDVVVSKPTGLFGGVVQFDMGKTASQGHFIRTGSLNKPPPVLLTALSTLQANHLVVGSRIPDLLREMVLKYPLMSEKVTHLGKDQDRLFESTYEHEAPEEKTCDLCDVRKMVQRPARPTPDPVIHYGLIASGNQVMKDSVMRDHWAQELGIICFEMEAAGLMDILPCLVIRGICDYADSHKNKQWQEYAAVNAAAYAKELLLIVPPTQVADTPTYISSELMSYRPKYRLPDNEFHLYQLNTIEHFDERLLDLLSTYDHEKTHYRLSAKRLQGTTKWFTNHSVFKEWFGESQFQTLWCHGRIGSGKTTIGTSVVEAAKYRSSGDRVPTAFYYCESDRPEPLEADHIVASLIKQLCKWLLNTSQLLPEDVAADIQRLYGTIRVKPDFEDLRNLFVRLFDRVPGTVYIIDGLDALSAKGVTEVLKLCRSLFSDSTLSNQSRLLLISREHLPGRTQIAKAIPNLRQISTDSNVRADIELYIESTIIDKRAYIHELTNDSVLLERIKHDLIEKSSEMFLWVHLQLEILWDTCDTDAEIRTALSNLPRGLEETYSRCLQRMDLQDRRVLKVLKWVSFTSRPLHIEELKEAIAIDIQDTEWDASKIPRASSVLIGCANLVVVDPFDNCARFAHSSVKQYFQAESDSIPEYPKFSEQGELECGELCVNYLCFKDFSLQITKQSKEVAISLPNPVSMVRQSLPSSIGKMLPRSWRNKTGFAFKQVQNLRAAQPDHSRYAFLGYAVMNWGLQTKAITRTSPVWEAFEQLALRFSDTWNFHPWVPSGRSARAYLHGLFGWAVKERHLPLLSIVLSAYDDLEAICNLPLVEERIPALHVAAKLGYHDVVEALLQYCDVSLQDVDGYLALHHAASKGHEESSKLLVTAKGATNYRAFKLKCTPLWLAASKGHEHIVPLLLQNNEYIEAKDVESHSTPLLQATKNNHYSTAKILIQRGAKIETRDRSGTSPLMWASKNRNDMIMRDLLEEGANPSTVDGGAEGLLIWAANKGYEIVVQRLSTIVTSLEAKDMDGYTALSRAAIQGHYPIVKHLLQKGAQTESRDEHAGRTALSWAVRAFDTVVVQTLLDQGADLEARDGFGRTPLSWAAEEGSAAVVQLLIDRGADVASDDDSGRTPLSWAAGGGNAEAVELLCSHGADPASQDYDLGRTPRSWAALNRHEAIAALLPGQEQNGSSLRSMELELLQATKDDDVHSLRRTLSIAHATGHLAETVLRVCLVESVTRENIGATQCLLDFSMSFPRAVHTALLRAIETHYYTILLMMLDYGASLNLRYADGNTLLMTAALKGSHYAVEVLIAQGAELNAKDHNRRNVLHKMASGRGPDLEDDLLDQILSAGCSLNDRDCVGRTPLHWACATGKYRMVQLMLTKSCGQTPDTQALDDRGMSALHFAVTYAWNDIVLLLLRNGANPNISNDEGDTPLHFAGMLGLVNIAQTLLLSGAKVAEQNVNGSTPLHLAARAGRANVVEILLQELPLPLLKRLEGLKDRHGQTALSLATSNGHEEVIDLLRYGGIGTSSKFTTPSTFGSITKEVSRSVSGYGYEDSK